MKATLTLLLILGIAAAWHFSPTQVPPVSGTNPARIAPDDIFYLREYVSITTPRGVVGLLPGQQLELDANAQPIPGKVVVTDGTNTVALDPAILTHDMDEAVALRNHDQDNQARQVTELALASADRAAQQRAAQMMAAQDISAENARRSVADAVGTSHSRLNDPTRYQGSASAAYYYLAPESQLANAGTLSRGSGSSLATSAANASSRVTYARPPEKASSMRTLPMRPVMTTGTRNGLATGAQ